jgi:hypothetical protein
VKSELRHNRVPIATEEDYDSGDSGKAIVAYIETLADNRVGGVWPLPGRLQVQSGRPADRPNCGDTRGALGKNRILPSLGYHDRLCVRHTTNAEQRLSRHHQPVHHRVLGRVKRLQAMARRPQCLAHQAVRLIRNSASQPIRCSVDCIQITFRSQEQGPRLMACLIFPLIFTLR